MFDEGTEVTDNTTSDETDSTNESNATETSEGSESDTITLTKAELEKRERELRKDQDKRWKERIKGLKGEDDGEGEKDSKESNSPSIVERLDRAELKAEGVKDKAEQDAVLEYARWKNIDVLTALNTPAMKAELKEMRNKSATPSSSNRTSAGARDEVAYWADQMEKGKRAPTPELRTKVLQYLAKNKR